MGRRRIETKDFVRDVRAGTSHSDLMKKYGLSQKVLDDVLSRLVKSGQLHPSDLMRDVSQSFESTLVVATTCPRCGALLWADSGECSNCLANRISQLIDYKETPSTESSTDHVSISEYSRSSVTDVTTDVKALNSLLPDDEKFVFDEVVEQEPEVTVDVSSQQEEPFEPEEPEPKPRRGLVVAATIFLSLAVPLAILFYTEVLEPPEIFRSTSPLPPVAARPQPPATIGDVPAVISAPQHPPADRRPAAPGKRRSLEAQIAMVEKSTQPREQPEQPSGEMSSPSAQQTTEASLDKAKPSPSPQTVSASETNTLPEPSTPGKTAAALPSPEPADATHGPIPSAEPSGNDQDMPVTQSDLNTALLDAVKEGRVERAMVLLDHGADVNTLDTDGTPLLMVAAELGQESLVDFLLKRGADEYLRDKNDLTALGRACEAGNARIIELLLCHDKSKGAADLLKACEKGETKSVELMLDRGADINARNSEGGTPLMIAAGKGHLELVEVLLNKGADSAAQDNKGFTALAWAYSPTAMNVTPFKIQREIIRLLKHHESSKAGPPASHE